MARKRKDTPKTPRGRRQSPNPVSSTPRRSLPSKLVLRLLSTPLHVRSQHPLLRTLSTPVRLHAQYHPLVRSLCQEGAYERKPYDDYLYVTKALCCERCDEVGRFTQTVAFIQGHAGEWVRACQNCHLVTYPAQPGTPADLLTRIEATRQATASSSTVATPNSQKSRSSASFSDNHFQGLDVTPSSIGGHLEDWLSPLFRELDMETARRMPTTSNSVSPDPVAGPSTGPGLGSLRNAPPQCARDEEFARCASLAVGREPTSGSLAGDRAPELTTVSSLAAELAAITGTQSRKMDMSLLIPEPHLNSSSRSTSRESSPSPRPRKKKRIIFKRSPTPPPVKHKFYGLRPSSPSPKGRAKARKPMGKANAAKPDAATVNAKRAKYAKPSADPSTAKVGPPTTQRDRSHSIINISSGDESAPPNGDGEDLVIDITSSDPDSNSAPPATQPRSNGAPPATTPRTARPLLHRLSTYRPPPATQPRRDDAPPATQPRTARRHIGRLSAYRVPHAIQQRANSPPPATEPRSEHPRALPHRARALPHRACALCASSTPPAAGAINSNVIDIDSSESDRDSSPPPTPPGTATSRAVVKLCVSPRDVDVHVHATGRDLESDSAMGPAQLGAVVRSRAPSREVEAHACSNDLENDDAPQSTQPRTTLGPRTRSLPATVDELEDLIEAGSSNKENNERGGDQSCLDLGAAIRLSAQQVAARRHLGMFALLGQTSSFSSSSPPSSSGAGEPDDNVSHISDAADPPAPEVQSSVSNAGERVDASEVFGHPFRFELYPLPPELARNVNPETEKRHWVLTVKIWYKNNTPPSTKMITLDYASCSIRLADVFIVARTFRPGFAHFRIWNRFITDWDARSLYDYLTVSIADNHTLLIRLPTVATLSSWAENISLAYGLCQTIDPRPIPSPKGKELAYH